MQYVSTRGGGEPVGFVTASLAGLAPDGGLFTPVTYPQLKRPDGGWSYNEIATHILSAFAGDDLPRTTVEELVAKAYASFSHESVAPLFQVGSNRWLMELHHGPTLAFKDVAMQVIGQLYDHALSERGERLTGR